MNPRTTLILAVLVAILGGFIYWTEQGDGGGDAEGEPQALFPDLAAPQVTAVAVRTSDGVPARLERSDGVWALVEPIEFPADDLAAEGLASSLVELASEAVFEEPEPLAEYGLDVEPTVRFETGDTERALRFGDKAPVGGDTYVAIDGDPRVYAVASWRVNALEKSLLDLRDRRVLDFAAEQVETARVRWPGGEVSLERVPSAQEASEEDASEELGGESHWRITAPLEARASAETVEGLLTSLQFLRASGFVDSPPDDAEAGLVEPRFEIELGVAGSDEPVRMALGKTTGNDRRLARGAVAGVLYEIEESRLGELPRRVSDYRFKTVSRFAAEDAARFELAFAAGQRIDATRGPSGWDTEPVAMAAGTASQVVEELSGLEAVEIAAESVGPEELAGLGLSPPAVTLRVFAGDAPDPEASDASEADGRLLASVHLGKADPERGIAARRGDEPVVYWLAFDIAEHLPVSYEAFENRFVSSEEPDEGAGEGADTGGAQAGALSEELEPSQP